MNTTTDSTAVKDGLKQVLADSYALLGITHVCHWNVEGPTFFALHDAFEQQYTELFSAIDEIAERIRALGDYVPGALSNWSEVAGIEEISGKASAEDMVKCLLAANQKLVKDLAATRDAASEGDPETEDMMIARIQVHEKTIWMLNSYLS